MTAANENLHPSHAFVRDLLLSGAMAQPTQGDRITLASIALHYAADCDRIGHLYFALISEAADHLRAAHLDELADRCDAIVADGFGGGGELTKIEDALRELSL